MSIELGVNTPAEDLCARTVEADLLALAHWIVLRGQDQRDHACATCVPGGEIVQPGFVCGYHRAVGLLVTIGESR